MKKEYLTASYVFTIAILCLIHVNSQAQATKDTLWGTGTFKLKDVNNTPIVGANIACTSIYIPGDTQPDNFITEFMEPTSNFVPFELPAWIDIYVGVKEAPNTRTEAKVFPNPSADFNFSLPGKALSELEIYNIKGQKVAEIPLERKNDQSDANINMAGVSDGTYVYRAMTTEGYFSGKIIKSGNTPNGKQSKWITPLELNQKSVAVEWEALYNINVTAEGYEPFNTEQTIVDGDNGVIAYILEPLPGIPQYQHIGGFTYDEDGTGLEGVTVRVYDQDTDTIIDEVVSNAYGAYLTSIPIPAGTKFTFGVGLVSGKYAYEGDEASVPNEITNPGDTITYKYRFVMYDKLREVPGTGTFTNVPSFKISDMVGNGNVEGALGEIEYWLGPSLLPAQITAIGNNYNQLEADIGRPGQYEESPTQLNQNTTGYNPYTNPLPVGINIEQGTNNTFRNFVSVTTPQGNQIEAVFAAEMTLTGVQYLEFVHENGRAAGFLGVSWYGIMRADSPEFTDDDKVIMNLAFRHFDNVYNNGLAYYTLKNIKDVLNPEPTRTKPYKGSIIVGEKEKSLLQPAPINSMSPLPSP